ncbi:hypothetical protein ACP70R_015649 [Stipagrostis hirtigluma subsp. patula]
MVDADDLEAARRLASLAFADLSLHDLSSSTSPPSADLPGLLRRCFSTLPPLDAGDPSLAKICRRRLLASLRGILSRDPSPSLVPAIEVFAENLLFEDQLGSCFTVLNSAAPEASRVFKALPRCDEDVHILLELVCHHFVSSLPEKDGFEVFWNALSWSGKASQGTPEIGFWGALGLVQNTSLFSLPDVVKAHILLLASRCISDRDLDSHLLAFEHAMNLYLRYLPALRIFKKNGPLSCIAKEKTFHFCIQNASDQKLRSQINGLLLFCRSHSADDLPPINDSDIFGSSVCFIEENKHMLHEKFRLEATMVVKSLLSNILYSAKQRGMHEPDAKVSEEIICLAAVLRLMGSSLLQILHQFSQMRVDEDMEDVNSVPLCREYNLIYEIIRLLGPFEADEIHRYDLFGIIGKPVDRGRASMLLLTHFASLSIFSIRMRLGFLWKGCIIMMMMAMNLVIAEEKSLGIFQFLIATVATSTNEGALKVYARRKKSSTAIALRYRRFHKVHSPNEGRLFITSGNSVGTSQNHDCRVAKADGRAFFMSHPEYIPNYSDWVDIEDFVECEPDKDYSYYLKQHKTFKKFKDWKWHRGRISKMKKLIVEM